MASSGSFNTGGYEGRYLTFSWSIKEQSVANNTTTISWTLKGAGKGEVTWYKAGNFKVVIAGETVYSSSDRITLYEGTTVASGTKTITHNSDGTKSFSASAEAGIYYYSVNCTGSGSWSLTTIPRASKVSCTNATIGNKPTITISKANSSFTHTLSYSFGSLTGTIVSKTTASSYNSWTIPDTFYAQIPNNTSGTGTITCDTYNGSTKVGTSTCNFTVSVNTTNSKPTLSPTVKDTNTTTLALTGDENKLVRYYSTAAYTIGASAKNSATIKSQSCTNNNSKKTTATGSYGNVENGTFTFSVTDSRGLTTTQTVSKTFINYVKLSCNLTADNPTIEGVMTLKISGNFFNGSFGTTSNTLTIQYRYSQDGGALGDWITVTPTKSGNTYSNTTTITGLNYKSRYVFQARAIDALDTRNSVARQVETPPVFDWGKSDFNFNVPVTIEGYRLADFVFEQGTSGGWRYQKWTSGKAECWQTFTVTTEVSTAYGNGYYNGSALTVDAPSGLFLNTVNPTININAQATNSQICSATIAGYNLSAQRLSYYVTSMRSQVSQQVLINVHIIGRWQ